jgi:hypothetical protein
MTYKSKYYNIKTRASDGEVFDSHKEARRWEELLLLQKAGKIVELRRQVPYELIPAQYETYERYSKKGVRLKDGKRLLEREVCYVADFVYTDAEKGELIVEDTKSKATKTKDFVIKRKLMLAIHGIRVREV